MFSFAHRERLTDHEGVTRTYHGALVPLYGLNDFALNLIFKHVFSINKGLLTDFNNQTPTRETKLKYIAGTPEGRFLLSQYSTKDTGIYAACRGLKTYVPDWYINKEGPIKSQYTSTDHIYSPYLHKPLSRDEFLHRFSEGAYKPTPLVNRAFFSTTNTFTKLFGLPSHALPTGIHGPLVERGEFIGEMRLDSDLIDFNSSEAAERLRTRASRSLTERQREEIEGSKRTSKLKAEYFKQQQKKSAAAAKLKKKEDEFIKEAVLAAQAEYERKKRAPQAEPAPKPEPAPQAEASQTATTSAKSGSEYETDPDEEDLPVVIQAPAGPIVIPDTNAKFENKMIELAALKAPELRTEAASLGIAASRFKAKKVYNLIVKFYVDNASKVPDAKEIADRYPFTDKRGKKKK